MSRKFIIRSVAFLMLYVAAASYILRHEEKFFFKHEELEESYEYGFDFPFQELQIKVNDELQLNALWFKQDQPKGLVLYYPDGDYQSATYKPEENYLYSIGYDLLIPDYRGNGKSTSNFQNEEDIYQDAEQWYKMAVRLADSSDLIICGKEFGSGVAAQVGGSFPADLLLLINPYYSWNELMLKKYFWWLPHSYFTQYKIPLWEFVRKSTNKIVLVHATKNNDYPLENSHRLLEFFKPGDELIELDTELIDQHDKDFQKSMEKIGYR